MSVSSTDRELFLIDGNSLAYRAFFALPESIATSAGRSTNAAFGLASMFAKIATEFEPGAVVVVWDAGLSGREKEYPEYKAGRPPKPDLLREQWPLFAPLADAFGFRNVSVSGYEADDVIASVATMARAEGIPVMVVTGDRDALQMVDEGIRVMATARGVTDTRLYDRQCVVDRYGIEPALVADFIGLKGDASDNIPGVPGIGEKTASELLNEFGSLESVLEHIPEIKGVKRRENLTAHADTARLSKRLATLNTGIEVPIDPSKEMRTQPDRSKLFPMLRELEFRELSKRLKERGDFGDEAGEIPVEETAIPDATPLSIVDFRRLRKEIHGTDIAVAVKERIGGDAVAAGAYAGGQEAWVTCAPDLDALRSALAGCAIEGHNIKPLIGAPPGSPKARHDTLIAAWLLDPSKRTYVLSDLAEQAGVGAAVRLDPTADDEKSLVSAGRDAVLAWRVAEAQRETLSRAGLISLFDDIEMPLVEVLRSMEEAGIELDVYRLGEITAKVSDEIDELEHEIQELAGEPFTIGSPQQLAAILFDKLGLPRKRRGKTGFSTDRRVLASIRDGHPIVPKIERWRELSKLKSTYLDALPRLIDEETGRLHTTFNQAATATGRLSSTDPNLQNVPVRTPIGKEIRDCFVAPEGSKLISADYSQVELRVLAHLADEPVLKEIFARGEDVHAATASQVFEVPLEDVGALRERAKAVNYGIVYGLSAHGLSSGLGISHEDAARFIESYLARFPAVREFIARTISKSEKAGYAATAFGRIRPIPELRSSHLQTRSLGERLAVNTVIQGSAADIIKVAMIDCRRALLDLGLRARLVLQIHDELLFESVDDDVAKVSETVRQHMESAYPMDPRLEIALGAGRTWLTAKG